MLGVVKDVERPEPSGQGVWRQIRRGEIRFAIDHELPRQLGPQINDPPLNQFDLLGSGFILRNWIGLDQSDSHSPTLMMVLMISGCRSYRLTLAPELPDHVGQGFGVGAVFAQSDAEGEAVSVQSGVQQF